MMSAALQRLKDAIQSKLQMLDTVIQLLVPVARPLPTCPLRCVWWSLDGAGLSSVLLTENIVLLGLLGCHIDLNSTLDSLP